MLVWWKNKSYSLGIYVPHIHWVVRGTGTPRDRDEGNRREVWWSRSWASIWVCVWSRSSASIRKSTGYRGYRCLLWRDKARGCKCFLWSENFFCLLWSDTINRELNRRPMYDHRCDERLKVKASGGIYTSHRHWLVWGTGTPKDRVWWQRPVDVWFLNFILFNSSCWEGFFLVSGRRGKRMEDTDDDSVEQEDPREWRPEEVTTFLRSLGTAECFQSAGGQVLIQWPKSPFTPPFTVPYI